MESIMKSLFKLFKTLVLTCGVIVGFGILVFGIMFGMLIY